MDDKQIAAAIPTGRVPEISQGASQTKARPFAIAQIASCLGLVRPVGMSDGMAEEWVRIAARDLGSFPDSTIAAACQKARMICNHHGKILPTVIAECEALSAAKARAKEYSDICYGEPSAALPETFPTLRELEDHLRWLNGAGETPQLLRKTGLGLRALLANDNGTVRFAPGVWKYTDNDKTYTV